MNRRNTFPPLVILILVAFVVTTSPSAAMPQHGPSASGTGQFRFRDPSTAQTELWSFSFEVTSNKNGKARGRAQFDNLSDQTQVVVRINCLRASSSFAVITGRVLHSDDPSLPKFTTVIFAATDGQALPIPGSDTITPPFEFPFGDCNDGEPLTILPLENGDIQIQP